MNRVDINLPDCHYPIFLANEFATNDDCLIELTKLVVGKKCLLVSDDNVAKLYADRVMEMISSAGGDCSRFIFPAGEGSKNLGVVERVYHFAIENNLNRKSIIIALGGGVVGDLSGFVAATYMRGVPFVQFPTSLLAMVDSSVGGKVGVDLAEGKNLVGAFHQPQAVFANLATLKTLATRELRCGLAEVVKYSIIMDAEFFPILADNCQKLQDLDLLFYAKIVQRCCQLKADIVEQDEKEQGIRAILNYGHTFGHALETIGGYEELNHGEGVAIGMVMAAEFAILKGIFSREDANKQRDLLQKIGLPISFKNRIKYQAKDILALMYHDKKVSAGKLVLILPEEIGKAVIYQSSDEDLELLLEAIESGLE